MGPTHCRTSSLRRYTSAHFGSYIATESPTANYRAYLKSVTLSSSDNLAELELSWLSGLGYTSGTLVDRWGAYIKAQGYIGYFPEQLRKFFEVA